MQDNFRRHPLYSLFCLCALVFACSLSGCASNYIRVTEYAGSALPIPGTNAAAGGCMVSQEGVAPPGELTYNGERCTYTTTPDESP